MYALAGEIGKVFPGAPVSHVIAVVLRDIGGAVLDYEVVSVHFVRDLAGGLYRLGDPGEELLHLLAGLEIEIVVLEPDAEFLVLLALQGYAHHGVLRVGVLAVDIMHIVGRHHLDPDIPREIDQGVKYLPLFREPVILQFDIKVTLGEHPFEPEGVLLRLLVVASEQRGRDMPRKTRRTADQPLRMLFEQIEVYPRLHVKPVHERGGGQPHEIAVARLVFGEQDEMIALVQHLGSLEMHVVGHIKFAADDGLEPIRAHHADESVHAVEIAVVCDGDGIHPPLFERVAKRELRDRLLLFVPAFADDGHDLFLFEAHRPVEKAVFAVQMQMYEIAHLFLCPAAGVTRNGI